MKAMIAMKTVRRERDKEKNGLMTDRMGIQTKKKITKELNVAMRRQHTQLQGYKMHCTHSLNFVMTGS